MVAGPLTTE
jgi:hypothetical protein